MSSPKRSTVADAVHVLLHLQRCGQATTAEISTLLDVDRRQARRVLKRLCEHAPIEHRGTGRERVWVLDPIGGQARLGIYDRIALRVGRDATDFLDGTPLAETLERADDPAGMPPRLAQNFPRKIRVKAEPSWAPDDRHDRLHEVFDGLLRERTLDLTYAARTGPRRYPTFRPLTLVAYRRVLYLFGYAQPDQQERLHRLRVDRIERAHVGEPFDYPDAWDPDAELTRWFGIEASGEIETVILEFSAHAAGLVRERIWHATQRFEPLPDGRLRLIMRTGGRELIPFALEWGEHCQVIAPPWLRRAVQTALTAALAQYGAELDA